jgi:hypothetical protein
VSNTTGGEKYDEDIYVSSHMTDWLP